MDNSGAHRRQDGVMRSPDPTVARSLCADFDASPTPYHAVDRVRSALEEAGYRRFIANAGPSGRWFHDDGGAIVAWAVDEGHGPTSPVRIVGAHTDSPNLRVKPHPDRQGPVGFRQLGVEVYGGALLNSWLDRDLGLAGRVLIEGPDRPRTVLFRDDRPILRIPQLAIHLDGEIRSNGLALNPQRHLSPIWGLGAEPTFLEYLAERIDVSTDAILAYDVMAHDLTPAAIGGLSDEFLLTARIDNQLSCFLAVRALLDAADHPGPAIPMIALFDHEEVGSVSTTGAAGPLLRHQVERIRAGLGASVDDVIQAQHDSLVISADGAHATHPNYADRHEPDHLIALNAGPVLKINANQRYATDARSGAAFVAACRSLDVPFQRFVNRTDLGCGSTIGPATAAELGLPVVDAGCPQLAMHSARETAGSHDPAWFQAVLSHLLRG